MRSDISILFKICMMTKFKINAIIDTPTSQAHDGAGFTKLMLKMAAVNRSGNAMY